MEGEVLIVSAGYILNAEGAQVEIDQTWSKCPCSQDVNGCPRGHRDCPMPAAPPALSLRTLKVVNTSGQAG